MGVPLLDLASVFKKDNASGEYAVDSFPGLVCDNIRVSFCRLYGDERFQGYVAFKKHYFYGLRVHMMVSACGGEPLGFFLEAGSTNDNPVFKVFELELPEGSVIYADKQYNAYQFESLLKEATSLEMKSLRRKNSKRQFAPFVEHIQQRVRKRMEASFSQIAALFLRKIHAVSADGFKLKIVSFILAFAIQFL